VLYNRDPRFATILMALLRGEQGLVVGDNEPYSVTDASDYTIPLHGEQRNLPHVAIEIRQDLIADDAGQRRWAGLFTHLLPQAYQRLVPILQADHETPASTNTTSRSAEPQ
jgi:predicted N-formylglutamate amidohydrolase